MGCFIVWNMVNPCLAYCWCFSSSCSSVNCNLGKVPQIKWNIHFGNTAGRSEVQRLLVVTHTQVKWNVHLRNTLGRSTGPRRPDIAWLKHPKVTVKWLDYDFDVPVNAQNKSLSTTTSKLSRNTDENVSWTENVENVQVFPSAFSSRSCAEAAHTVRIMQSSNPTILMAIFEIWRMINSYCDDQLDDDDVNADKIRWLRRRRRRRR